MAGEVENVDKDKLISQAKASELYGFNQAYLAWELTGFRAERDTGTPMVSTGQKFKDFDG